MALGGTVLSFVGAGMHFVYEKTGCNPVAAFFCAVNESVYEHMKIMLVPILAWWVVLVPACYDRAWPNLPVAASALYAAMVLLLVGNAGLSAIESLAADITLFCVCIFVAQAVGVWVRRRGPGPFVDVCSLLGPFLFLLVLVMLSVCTFFPPRVAYLFEDHRNHTYGRPDVCP